MSALKETQDLLAEKCVRIAELERLLDVERRAVTAAQEHADRLDKSSLAACQEIEELDKVLHEIVEGKEHEPRAAAIASRALGL